MVTYYQCNKWIGSYMAWILYCSGERLPGFLKGRSILLKGTMKTLTIMVQVLSRIQITLKVRVLVDFTTTNLGNR